MFKSAISSIVVFNLCNLVVEARKVLRELLHDMHHRVMKCLVTIALPYFDWLKLCSVFAAQQNIPSENTLLRCSSVFGPR